MLAISKLDTPIMSRGKSTRFIRFIFYSFFFLGQRNGHEDALPHQLVAFFSDINLQLYIAILVRPQECAKLRLCKKYIFCTFMVPALFIAVCFPVDYQ
jgi:hypothetical protein